MLLRVAARGLRAPPRELAGAFRSRCSAFEGRPPVHPTLVLEESVTGLEPGFPMVTDKEIWKQPEMLLPERAELWYDDGTAVPEFYIDNDFPVSDSRALAECASAIAVIVCGGLALGYLLGDRLNPTQGEKRGV